MRLSIIHRVAGALRRCASTIEAHAPRTRCKLETALLALLLLPFATPTGVTAQTVLDISGAPTCRGCRLAFTRIAVLGTVDGPGALAGEPTSVVLDSRGNYYVTQFKQRYLINQFTRTGQFVRTIGREGRGPGEYLYIVSLAIGANDSLYVVDHGNARIAVLSPSHDVARTIPFAGQFFSALITKAGIIANAHWPRAESLGKPLRTTGMDGSVKAVYGATKPHFAPRAVYSVMRSIAAGQDSSIWAGEKTRYVIEEWSVDGKPLRSVTRNVIWFPAYEQRMKASATRPSEPWLVALRQERGGRLWTAITVPDSEWSKRWTELGFTEDKGVEPDQRIFDTVIEVLDLTRKAVVFSQRLPHYIHGFLNDSTPYGYSVDSDEIPRIEIWRFRLIDG